MTIIAYDGDTIAADRQMTADRIIVGYTKKIFKYAEGYYSYTGSVVDGPRFAQWLEDQNHVDLGKEFAALVSLGKRVFIVDHKLRPWRGQIPCAIGSSFEAAEMLMRTGMTAKEACQWICKYDITCGGKVDCVEL